jgi:hypothetical protein
MSHVSDQCGRKSKDQLTSLSLKSIDNVEGCDSLPLCVLSVCDSIADDTFEEGLEDTTSLFVDHWKAGLASATSGRRREEHTS